MRMRRRYRIGPYQLDVDWWIVGGIVLFWLTYAIYQWAHR
jgi:hypothetical protein